LGSARAETREGGNGNDIIYGGGGADTVLGGAGNDTISYHDGMRVDGGEGYDTLLADESTVASGIHFNVLGSNFESIGGRGGNDVIDARGLDYGITFADHGGIDTFVKSGTRADYAITQYAGDGNSWLITNKASGIQDLISYVEKVQFSDGTLDTATLSRQLGGTEGNDVITGAKGNDVIGGGGGSDTLDGGFGADALTGGLGNDLFIFHKGEANGDVITDFAGNGVAAGDRLQFAGYGAGASFHQVGATDQWQIDYNGGIQHETITLSNHATVHASDVLFV
jgi:Ca2+-binding RTX toxin-like protein